ncbi:MAG: ribulose-phosphate 3-epimerase [Kiritimatiellae bacterium]|nr:ribulose-phosphate 3-epimerase [Kiritimatiellia bacterium]MDD4736520.1 ribulose-phosphate 3-epimerase [Kiritimatiellia bacterium]
MKKTNWIAPSILSADFSRLGEEVQAVVKAGADLIHFDVMDNHYVPNLTVGPLVCEALAKRQFNIPLDVHLMTRPVDSLIPSFAKAGATYISFHPEATDHVDRTINMIREHGAKPGLAFNPATPLDALNYTLHKLDLVLIMSVNPGFGGQAFIPEMLQKISEVRTMIEKSGKPIRLEVDGGINADNIRDVMEAGADTFVAGSAIFSATDYTAVINQMRQKMSD